MEVNCHHSLVCMGVSGDMYCLVLCLTGVFAFRFDAEIFSNLATGAVACNNVTRFDMQLSLRRAFLDYRCDSRVVLVASLDRNFWVYASDIGNAPGDRTRRRLPSESPLWVHSLVLARRTAQS